MKILSRRNIFFQQFPRLHNRFFTTRSKFAQYLHGLDDGIIQWPNLYIYQGSFWSLFALMKKKGICSTSLYNTHSFKPLWERLGRESIPICRHDRVRRNHCTGGRVIQFSHTLTTNIIMHTAKWKFEHRVLHKTHLWYVGIYYIASDVIDERRIHKTVKKDVTSYIWKIVCHRGPFRT